MIHFKQHSFPQSGACTAKRHRSLLIAGSLMSFIVSGCSGTGTNVAGNSANPLATPVSNQNLQKTSSIRLAFQKGGGAIPIARQRGELERELAAQNIKIEWSSPFDRCASLLQALNGNRADIGGCGDIPTISGIAAGQALCIGAVQRPRPDVSVHKSLLVQIAYAHADGATPYSAETSKRKAQTAASTRRASGSFSENVAVSLPLASGNLLTNLGGGLSIRFNGAYVGGIGVGGGTVEQDIAIAQAALQAIGADPLE
jgi:hypothetical protein